MICILLQNIKDDILKNVSSHTVSVTKIVSSTEEKVIPVCNNMSVNDKRKFIFE